MDMADYFGKKKKENNYEVLFSLSHCVPALPPIFHPPQLRSPWSLWFFQFTFYSWGGFKLYCYRSLLGEYYSKNYGGYLNPTQRFPLAGKSFSYTAALLLENLLGLTDRLSSLLQKFQRKKHGIIKNNSISYPVMGIFRDSLLWHQSRLNMLEKNYCTS